jgi:transcriptional regulator with XRE-family HTH domain
MRARMRERGITQAALSEQLRVSQGTVCRWQLGERYPTDANARRLEKILGIPMDAWRQAA